MNSNEMQLFIPTLRRPLLKDQRCLARLPSSLLPNTTLVLDPDDYAKNQFLYDRHEKQLDVKLHIVPPDIRGIARTREYIGRSLARDKFVMLDDDIQFYHRKDGDEAHLFNNTQQDTEWMFRLVEDLLNEYAHVGVSVRQMNNTQEGPRTLNTRYVRLLAYRREPFVACEHGRVEVMEDFDIALQLLRAGHACCVINSYAQGQPGTQSAGGCSVYRTHELHERSAVRLAELHPGFVRLREKHNKTGGEFGHRTEVTISWKKAYGSSQGEKVL